MIDNDIWKNSLKQIFPSWYWICTKWAYSTVNWLQTYADEDHGLRYVQPHFYHAIEDFLDECFFGKSSW